MNFDNPRLAISITVFWLLTFVAITGILVGFQAGFMVLLPMNILIYIIFIIWNTESKRTLLSLFIPFFLGVFMRVILLRYDWILGPFQYGETMSYKIQGVPITIGVSWAIQTYCSAAIAQHITKSILKSSLLATLLSLGLHLIFAISAMELDLWNFENGRMPIRYPFVMFCVGFIIQFLFQKSVTSLHLKLSIHMFLTILVFAIGFLFL